MSKALLKMKPLDGVLSDSDRNWCLPNRQELFNLRPRGRQNSARSDAAKGAFSATWLNPRTGALTDANGGTVKVAHRSSSPHRQPGLGDLVEQGEMIEESDTKRHYQTAGRKHVAAKKHDWRARMIIIHCFRGDTVVGSFTFGGG